MFTEKPYEYHIPISREQNKQKNCYKSAPRFYEHFRFEFHLLQNRCWLSAARQQRSCIAFAKSLRKHISFDMRRKMRLVYQTGTNLETFLYDFHYVGIKSRDLVARPNQTIYKNV